MSNFKDLEDYLLDKDTDVVESNSKASPPPGMETAAEIFKRLKSSQKSKPNKTLRIRDLLKEATAEPEVDERVDPPANIAGHW